MTIGRSYFDVLGTRTGAGQRPDRLERESRRSTAAIVNEQFAAVYFGSRDPIGHRLALTAPNRDGRAENVEIIGVAPNIRQSSTEAQVALDPIVYVRVRRQSRCGGEHPGAIRRPLRAPSRRRGASTSRRSIAICRSTT